jgi:hypothetical protein
MPKRMRAMAIRPRRRRAIASYDVRALRRARIRARALRVLLAAVSVGLLAAAAASARNLDVRQRSFLPPGSTGVVVLDLSLSIAESNYPQVRRAVKQLIAADAPVGLVIFSDVAYELLPPGTPASELDPLLRLLTPPRNGPPLNPWWGSFRAGTRISSALKLAKAMLVRDHVRHGFIVLVSDLETAPEDVESMTSTVSDLRRSSIDMRVIPISPSSDGLRLYRSLLGTKAFAELPRTKGKQRLFQSALAGGLPTTLLILGALLFAALGVNERFAGRLALPRSKRASA